MIADTIQNQVSRRQEQRTMINHGHLRVVHIGVTVLLTAHTGLSAHFIHTNNNDYDKRANL